MCLVAGSLAACTRGEGESCQIDKDCEDALVCCIAQGAARGTCASSTERCTQVLTTDSGKDQSDSGSD
jgi:hypothetical protein